MSKRDWKLLLGDIIEAIESIMEYTKEMNYEDFISNKLVSDAVMQNITVIGEASNRLSEDIKNEIPDISWQEIRGMRNRIIHDYFGIDYIIVWEVITADLPDFKNKIETYLNHSN